MSRFAQGRAFRLAVGCFSFAGLADLRLQLHVVSGPLPPSGEHPCVTVAAAKTTDQLQSSCLDLSHVLAWAGLAQPMEHK